ncbi:hypothetical protein [Aneurinibacillus aneurinilyticus]|jgi:hypothetical protein|uniref:hypothetical protein n=1 Tax=Aneurinibacillus aneurinilyticus TaxID=1391 RepID=UPI0023F94E2C|nr:hypothetical protein [Aneurinibacillus aneurinilyticus]MCI1693281.1 hypothetical protein [Aneurinibacillus aneurinilyticus]
MGKNKANIQRWLDMPSERQQMFLANVWCVHCRDVVTIIDYKVEPHDIGVVLRGKCNTCGHAVARVIEMDN